MRTAPTAVSSCLLFSLSVACQAANYTLGPRNPGGAESWALAPGEEWITPTNALLGDARFTVSALPAGGATRSLAATNFTLAVPGPATVKGVKVEVRRAAAGSGISDFSVRLLTNGIPCGEDRAQTSSAWTTNAYRTYGGSNDLWGLALAPANVSAAGFGVALVATNFATVSPATAKVDHVRMTVYYEGYPEIGILGTNLASIAIDESPVRAKGTDFGRVLLRRAPVHCMVVTNSGGGVLNLSNRPAVVLTGDTNSFRLLSQPATNIAALAASTFWVRFAPTSIGAATVTVSLASNDSDEPLYRWTLVASGADRRGPPNEGLVNYYPFDDSLEDKAGEYSAFSLTDSDLYAYWGNVRYEPGVRSNAVAINMQAGDLCTVGTRRQYPYEPDVDLLNSFTFEFWLYPSAFFNQSDWNRFINGGIGSPYQMQFNRSSGGYTIFGADAEVLSTSAGTPTLGVWQHIAGVADASNRVLRVYRNGVQVGSLAYDGNCAIPGFGTPIAIGNSRGDAKYSLKGYVDELAVWCRALDAETVMKHYLAGPDGFLEPPLPVGPMLLIR